MSWSYYIEDKSRRIGVIRYEFKSFKVYCAYREWDIEGLRSNVTPNSTAISFENYLFSIGYKPYEYCFNDRKLVPMKPMFYYSTMGHLHSYYIHPDNPDLIFTCGLNEKGMPPVLISPRPITSGIIKKENGYVSCWDDNTMHRLHKAYSDEEIYNAIINKTSLELPQEESGLCKT